MATASELRQIISDTVTRLFTDQVTTEVRESAEKGQWPAALWQSLEESGLTLRILQSGDASEMVTKALLTAGDPLGDVLFGVDNNLLSRALDGDLFDAYESPALESVDERYVLDPDHRVTPIDHGEVCLNYDKAWFADRGVAPPGSLEELADFAETAREPA